MKTLFKIIFIFSYFFFFTQSIHACSPGADHWYNTTVEFDINNLPEGVKISRNIIKNETYISNTSDTPFYLVSEGRRYWEDFAGSGVPEKYTPEDKLVSNKAYYWSDSSDSIGWRELEDNEKLEISKYRYNIEGEYKQVYEDDRPFFVEIPNPQKVTVLALYKEEEIVISGVLTYSLNNNYDPDTFKKGVEACARFNRRANNFGVTGVVNAVRNRNFFFTITSVIGVSSLFIYRIKKTKK